MEEKESKGSVDFLLDQDFLHLDQSKTSLDQFDDPDSELDHRSPAEWLQACSKGFSPLYANGEWSWSPCRVVGYDYCEGKYEIEFSSTGRQKKVQRLSLRFHSEDEHAFQERLSRCERRREYAKSLVRLEYFIERQSADAVEEIPAGMVEHIVRLGRRRVRETKEAGVLSSSIVSQVQASFCHALKRAVLRHVYFRDKALRDRFEFLKLPGFLPLSAPPVYGKVQIPMPVTSFDATSDTVANVHFSKSPGMYKTVSWLEDVWKDNFGNSTCFSHVLSEDLQKALPMSLEEFVMLQKDSCEKVFDRLAAVWRKGVINGLLDNLGNEYNFYESSMERVIFSNTLVLFKRFNLQMANQLRDFSARSTLAWVEFVKGTLAQRRELFGVSPIVKVQLDLQEGKVLMKPSRTEIIDGFTSIFKFLQDGLKTLFTVDDEMLSLHAMEKKLLIDLADEDDDNAGEIRKLIATGRAEIEAALELDMASVDSTLKAYAETNSHVAKAPTQFGEEFLGQFLVENEDGSVHSTLTTDQMHEQLGNFVRLANSVESLSLNEQGLQNLLLSCTNIKEKLGKQTRAYVDCLKDYIVSDKIAKPGQRIKEEFNSMLEQILIKPKNEKELVQLEHFVEKCNSTIRDYNTQIASIHSWLHTLNCCGEDVSFEVFELIWALKFFPLRVKKAEQATRDALEVDKAKMIEKLTKEKAAFEAELDNFVKRVDEFQTLNDYDKLKEIVAEAYAIEESLSEATEQVENFNMRDSALGFNPSEYVTLDLAKNNFANYRNLWVMSADLVHNTQEWITGEFKDLDGDEVEAQVNEWWTQSYRLMKTFGTENEGAAAVAARLREDSDAFKKNVPLIRTLASPALRDRHWLKLSEILNADINPEDGLTLQSLLDRNVMDYWEQIEEITVKAEKEFSLEKSIEQMKDEWDAIEFECMEYKETGTYVIKGTDDVIALLDDHVVKVQTMLGSPFIKPIIDVAKAWEHSLQYLQAFIDQVLKCQRSWMYLEPIFQSPDIMRQMPTEARRFQAVDGVWRKVLSGVFENPKALDVTNDDKVVARFEQANEKLELIQTGLNDYLEVKRMAFARFFFLSNDELLEIVSQTKDPQAVQPFLGKCFEGMASVEFTPELRIVKMISNEGEVVELSRVVDTESGGNKGNVELWLGELELSMRITVKDIIQEAMKAYPRMAEDLTARAERKEWVLAWPGQVVLNASQLYWTEEVTMAIKKQMLDKYTEQLNEQLLQIVHLVRGKLSKMERTTLGALCVIDVHQRDVILEMAQQQVRDPEAFEWLSQLRYYWEHQEDDFNRYGENPMNMMVRILNATQMYAYEYLGNSSRLVITPLTDRCYRTLMGAVSLLYGGAPAGPAGTGKTETTKDLAKAIAKFCVVFNCSDGLDYLAMAKFFKGLAQSGAWACFDEFNRIELEVLSVIAQQILTIVNAKRERAKVFEFEGSTLNLNPDANCFITMNPGYAGRQELPDNLQALFRPCAMMVPNYALIAEIKLFAFGFADARTMARKLTQVLVLCSEQLSSQKHYDYGMRAVFSILVRAGVLRQRLGDQWSEPMIVLSAVTDVNLPKFNTNDIPLFKGITSDLFPGVQLPTPDYGLLIPTIKEVCEEDNLEATEPFLRAVIQLYETVMVRHGLMVVGEALSGKTKVIHTLAKAMTKIKGDPNFEEDVHMYTMNPKSITQGQLYGSFDENTHEWTDGILAVTYRDCSKDTSIHRKWIIFDGPVDAVWIEDMNTVLDDNKKLCLQSGEIVKMSPRMTMMFEAEDLDEASPATVSRVGMVFLEQARLGWRPLVSCWINTLPDTLQAVEAGDEVIALFEYYFEPVAFFVKKKCKVPTPVTTSELCCSVLSIMESFLFDAFLVDEKKLPKDPIKCVEGCFVFALIWAIGGVTDAAGRRDLDVFLLKFLAAAAEEDPTWLSFVAKNPSYANNMDEDHAREQRCPVPGGCFEYVFQASKCSWVPWAEITPKYVPANDATYQSLLVPTIDTVRVNCIVHSLLMHEMPVLCTGDTGTGKTVSLKKLIEGEMDPEKYQSLFLNFSAQTSANQTQDIIDGKLDKRQRGVFGPPIGYKMIIMVDDLNMPKKETYGAQPPIEILRQWMDHGGWYDRKENTFRKLVDLQFVAAMGPPGGGRSQITQRYVRHFTMINLTPFDADSLSVIFGTIMEWFIKKFSPKVKALAASIVSATIDLYSTIEVEMLPTPAKSHYTFNLRDLSKVFQGVCMGHPSKITEADQLIRLWGHECTRVFHDRLINEQDREWFHESLADKVDVHFKKKWNKIHSDEHPLIYGNFIDPTQLVECRVYEEITDITALEQVMKGYLEDYNNVSSKKMNLVLFLNAIEHVARIVRVISQPMANALLVGVGGSGRKSLTTLAVSLCEQELFQIEISKVYGMVEWREDLKKLLMMAGMENKPTCFLFSDTQVVLEGFVEDINNILNTGEVPNLFNLEEQVAIVEGCRPHAEKKGLQLHTSKQVLSYFVEQCRSNLHVVLAFSPVGDAFRNRLRQFPSLVNCCAIDWFMDWPNQALRSVANYFLEKIEMPAEQKSGVVDVCVDMQQRTSQTAKRYFDEMRRYFYVTPTSYLELINTFKAIISKKRDDLQTKRSRYENGLTKLQETADQVAEMQIELEALQPKLVVAQRETDEKLVLVQGKQEEADAQRVLVEKDEAEATAQAESCEKDKKECEEMLAVALPALDAAVKALKTLSKSDIVEVKAMKKPPPGVKLTMEAVCMMMKVKPKKIPNPEGRGKIDDYWEPAQKELLGDPKFLNRLMEYDKDNIDASIVAKVSQFTLKDTFQPDVVKKASVAAAGLCKWVHAMISYDKVAKVVAPKKAALAQANSDLAAAMDLLKAKQADLQAVLDNVAKLKEELQETMDFKDSLEKQVSDCATKLERASQLIGGLGGEKTRWTQFVADLTKALENAVGDVLLSSGVVAYLGPFTRFYRENCITEWVSLLDKMSIPSSKPFKLSTTLGEPVKIRHWTINKLPNDDLSIDNAIMLFSSNRWPLIIDPQGQANKWIRNIEAENSVKVVKQTQNDFVRNIENSVSFGIPVLLENVPETLDPVLEPLLTKQVITKGGAMTIQLGDNVIDYDPRFRMYITTKLSNPHYPPETCVKVNLLNFMATQEGLQDQMLGITVKRETPELEKQREQLVVEDAENKRILKEIEDKILELLAKAEGNILDDEVLINTLSDSKKTSDQIMKAVAVAAKTQKKIEQTRRGYTPVAVRSSSLFFCVADLATVDPMYQFSLEWYTTLFNLAIDRATPSSELEERLDYLSDAFTKLLYENVCRSLFEKDKLLFSFLLCIKSLQINKELNEQEFRYFLTGSTAVDLPEANPTDWLNDKSWGDFLGLEITMPDTFAGFTAQVKEELPTFWKSIFNAQDPLRELAVKFEERFDSFQILLLLRCIRPDKVVPGVLNFILEKSGQFFIEPPPFDLLAGYKDSTSTTPILFVLTPGADPMTELLRVAEELGCSEKLFAVSLGQGQGPIAEKAVEEAVDKGTWVCLQNCHVAASWLPTLEKLCEDLSPERVHDEFRLWLTALPCAEFPVSVLQNGIKITLEPPKGFRANITGSYIAIDAGWFESCPKSEEFKKLCFGICFFHALVRERCNFGPLGWNNPYTFSVPDLRITLDQLMLFLTDYDEIPFKMLHYLAGECNYGGRVTDDKDRRCLLSILNDFYTPRILDPDYKFSPSGTYYAPDDGKLQHYMDYVKSLPFTEAPEVFGLHENAEITSSIKQTNALLNTVVALQPRSTGGSGKSWAETIIELAVDIEKKMPDLFDLEKAMVMYPVKFEESMNTVLVQELGRFNQMLRVIKKSLADIQLAIKGFVVMSQELEDMGNAMTSTLVPAMWQKVAYPSLKPLGSWVNDLLQRISFLTTWLETGKPISYWISGFYFIPGFLTGTRQNFARKYTIPIDLIKYTFRVLTWEEGESLTEPAADGAYINGLFLEGAGWSVDDRFLIESTPKELFVPMPMIQLIPIKFEDMETDRHVYECPIYKTSERFGMLSTTGHSTNFVMFIDLNMSEEHTAHHWIKRGVAMLTQLDS